MVPSATKLATGGINLRDHQQIRFFATLTGNMKLAKRLGCRTRAREFIEARVLRLLWDTCCHHAEARVHCVAALQSVRAGSQGRDLDEALVRRHSSPMKPQSSGFRVLVRLDEPPFSRCSCGVSEPPQRAQPHWAEAI